MKTKKQFKQGIPVLVEVLKLLNTLIRLLEVLKGGQLH